LDFEKLKSEIKKCKVVLLICLPLLLIFFSALIFFFPPAEEESAPSIEEKPIHSSFLEEEIRGVYIASVSNLNFPSKAGLSEEEIKDELDSILSSSKEAGFNTIYFQVRPSSDALYQSSLFPTSRYLVPNEGDPVSLDPLFYLVEAAKEYGIKIIAWVNPYRITTKIAESKEVALATLSEANPAKIHPEWSVFYDGRLYFNPALSEVQDLVVAGVSEIVQNYAVSGILFDDYFYPYPVEGEEFSDQMEYQNSKTSLSLSDWRRENVNQMVKRSYQAVKAQNSELTFGISPFGIWQNTSSDSKGSNTSGLEAYSALYCDALAWIHGGYVDYIAPQIYWEHGFAAAEFATLCRWWEEQTKGTGVGLVISHAAYKAADFSLGGIEIAKQIRFVQEEIESCGSIQYGFADIKKNTAGVFDQIQSVYADISDSEQI
jgi:uncharacterized lipoprotein YddW (UPF0748 family)